MTAIPSRDNAARSAWFFGSLVIATALPLLALPAYGLSHWTAPTPALVTVGALWVLTGYGHVVSTVWFGADPDYRSLILTHRLRMLASLAVIPLAMGLFALVSTAVSAWLYASFLAWQAHHFSRQNYGIVAFAAAGDRMGPLPRSIGWVTVLASVTGALGMLLTPGIYPVALPRLPFLTPELTLWGRLTQAGCLLAAAALIARLVIVDARLRASPRVLLFLGLGWTFFLPSLLSGAPQMTFWPYAMAHGAQYLVITGISARRSPLGWAGFGLFAATAVALGVLVFHPPGIVLVQAYTGVVIWHFLADARLWRLRDPSVRAIVGRRFDFLFGGRGSDARPAPGPAPSLSPAAAVGGDAPGIR
jgi:hypothetical protein